MKLKSIISFMFFLTFSNIKAQDLPNKTDFVGTWEIIYPFSEQVDTITFSDDNSWESNEVKNSDISSRKRLWGLQSNKIHLQYADKRDPNYFEWEVISFRKNTLEVLEKRYNNGGNNPLTMKLTLHKLLKNVEKAKQKNEVPPNGTFIFTVKDFESSKTGKWKVIIKGNKATIYSLGQEIWDTNAKKGDLIAKTNIIKFKGKWISVNDNELDKDFETTNGGQFETRDLKNKVIGTF